MADEQEPQLDFQKTNVTQAGEPAMGRSRLTERLSQSAMIQRLRTTDPSAAIEWFQGRMQSGGFGFYGKLATVMLCAWFLSDVAAVLIRGMIPESTTSRARPRIESTSHRVRMPDDYQIIY